MFFILMMYFLFLNFLSNFNPMNMLISFTLMLSVLMLNMIIVFNDKWILMVMMLFFVGGMMIFICMISSTFKFNLEFKKKNLFSLILMFSFLFLLLKTNVYSYLISYILLDNFLMLFFCLIILFLVYILKKLMFKKQKNLKIYVVDVILSFYK